MTPENVIYRDALDVLFEDRNKAYGAYQLRRDYPKYLRNALLLTLLGVLLLFAAPYFFASMAGVFAA